MSILTILKNQLEVSESLRRLRARRFESLLEGLRELHGKTNLAVMYERYPRYELVRVTHGNGFGIHAVLTISLRDGENITCTCWHKPNGTASVFTVEGTDAECFNEIARRITTYLNNVGVYSI